MLKRWVHRLAIRAERIYEHFFPQGRKGDPLLEAYRGYATPEHLILRGRVLTSLRRSEAAPTQTRWVNLKQMFSLFLTDEVADVTVIAPGTDASAVSDEEGYIQLLLPREGRAPGWHIIELAIDGGSAAPVPFPVFVPHPDAQWGVISDVDDTMMRTGAYSLAKNLWTTFTGSAVTREVFQDSIALMQILSGKGRNPVYYVSSSPWNLFHFLDTVFSRAGLVPGPMFLRDLGVSETQFVSGTHGDHKGAAIDAILAANPDLTFVLIGDTGQHDAHVYHHAVERHPGRIAAIVLREPGPGPDGESKAAMEAARHARVPVYSGVDFTKISEPLSAHLTGVESAAS